MKRRRGFFNWRRQPTLMDRVEEWLPEEIAARIPDSVEKALRKRLDNIDLSKLEAQLAERLGHLDRAKLEELIQAALEAVQARQWGAAARSRIPDRQSIESAIRESIDAVLPDRLEQLLRERRAPTKAAPAQPAAFNPLGALITGTTRLALLAAGGWIAYSHLVINHQVALPKALAAEQITLAFKPTGPLCLYRDLSHKGRPLLLVHSVNAAASAYEMRPIFEHFRTKRPTYALDLPGFGFSARPAYAYTPATYVQAILTALDTIYEENGRVPVDVTALSLGCEFAAEAARQRPDLVRALVLISPSGMQAKPAPRQDGWLYPALTFKLWARPFFDLLVTKRSIRYFLGRSFVGPVPDDLVDYAYTTAHQPDAEHAPLAFVGGRLFTPAAVDRIYRKVEQPTLVLYDEDAFVSFDRLPELTEQLSNWKSERVAPTRGLPHWEKPADTNRLIDDFFSSLA